MNELSVANLPSRATTWMRILRWRWLLRDCPLFVPQWYREHNPDVMGQDSDALAHYLTCGWLEGRDPGPEFNGKYYLARNPDVAACHVPPLLHYWVIGRNEARHPNPSMDLEWNGTTSSEPEFLTQRKAASEPGDGVQTPLISVIIPTYNRERLLPGVLDAWREVDRVTTIPYEILFSDDGSEDGTLALLGAVSDLPIRVLRNTHGGASAARNSAIRDARGRRLLIIGDDIFPDPDLINVHWRLGETHGASVATLGVVDWHPDLQVNHLMEHITEIGNEQFSYNRLTDGKFVDFRHFYTCNICVDRDILNRQDTLFDHRFDQYGFEDIELGYRLSLQGLRILFTRSAKGDHFHPYAVDGFCRRQQAAGRMAVVFRDTHPSVGKIVGVAEPENALRKRQPVDRDEQLWQGRLAKLIQRTVEYERLFEQGGRGVRSVLGQCLSAIYAPLFRAMYDYGVLQRLAGHDKVLAIAMDRQFGSNWLPYLENLNETVDLQTVTRGQVDATIEAIALNSAEVDDPIVASLRHELSVLKSIYRSAPSGASQRERWRRRISTGMHYLRHDRRQLAMLVKAAIKRRVAQSASHRVTTSSAQASIALSSAIGLILDRDTADRLAKILRFRDAFGNGVRVFELVGADGLRELGQDSNAQTSIYSLETVPCGVLYWPEQEQSMPPRDALVDGWLAVVENGLDVAILSYGFGAPDEVSAGSVRDHLIFSKRVAESLLLGRLASAGLRGKVVRIEEDPARVQLSPRPLDDWLGALTIADHNGLFSTRATPEITLRYLKPQFPEQQKHRPVVFVFPIFVAVGGVERNTVEIIRQLNHQYNFVVITMERLRLEQGSLGRQFQEVGARLVQMSEFARHADYLKVLSHLKGWLQPDLVWVCNGSPWLADNAENLRYLFSDVPIVDQQVYDVEQGWIDRYGEPGIRSFDRFIAVNQKIHGRFVGDLGRNEDAVDLIYSAVDTNRIEAFKHAAPARAAVVEKYGLPQGKRLFAFIGRLTSQKRPLEFLRIAAARRKNLNEFFVLVGDGELGQQADEFIRAKALDNVKRLPYVANTLELDSVLDGLIITSAYEGLPIAMLEALTLAVPVFASDVGDIGVVLAEFGGGVIYPVDATAPEVLRAFETWLSKREGFREALAHQETAIMERFSSRRIAGQYVDCFDRAMSAYRGRNI